MGGIEKRIKLMWPPKMASMGTLSRTLEKGKLMWPPKMANVVTLSMALEGRKWQTLEL
jgi:hypothetical protein